MTPLDYGYTFDVEGHRGCRGLMPENTLAAFKHALELGVTTLELDIGITMDGVIVVSHDRYLNPKKVTKDSIFISNKPLIEDLTYEEILQYDVGIMRKDYFWPLQKQIPGEKMPKLEEVFEMVKEYEKRTGRKVFLNIETKVSPEHPDETFSPEFFVDKLLELVFRYGMQEQVIVQSFYWKTIMLVKEKAPEITTAALLTRKRLTPLWLNGLKPEDFSGDIDKLVKASGADIFSPKYSECTREWIESAHAQGLLVIPWTINDRKTMKRFIDMGVDGIITDYPDVLLELVNPMDTSR